jgi:hypothetical protein
MPEQVCMGALLKCSHGAAPSVLVVTPEKMVTTSMKPAANIMDHVPMKNIMPFVMCNSMSNPAVSAATSAAMGVLTPMPCTPTTPKPWSPGAKSPPVTIKGQPALDKPSTLTCTLGGTIEITDPGQASHTVP